MVWSYTGVKNYTEYDRIDELSTIKHIGENYPSVFITVGDADPLETQTLEFIDELKNNLAIKYFERNEEWYDYIRQNRSGCPDLLASYDIIIGPIANDTIYNLAGITTSGFLDKEKALGILMMGPEYKQITIKTEKAANALQFIDAVEITKEEIEAYRKLVCKEEQDFHSDEWRSCTSFCVREDADFT